MIDLSERGVCTSKIKCSHIYWYESSSLFRGRNLTPEINVLIHPVSLYRLLHLLCSYVWFVYLSVRRWISTFIYKIHRLSIAGSQPLHLEQFFFSPQKKKSTNCRTCKCFLLKPNRIGPLYETLYVNRQQ